MAAAAGSLALATAAPAQAVQVTAPLARGLVGPLGLSVTPAGTVYVAQNFSGAITRIGPEGARRDVLRTPGPAGVLAEPDGSVVFTRTEQPEEGAKVGQLRRLRPDGTQQVLGRIRHYEVGQNPDRVNSYGFQDLSAGCRKQVPQEVGGWEYRGIVDSNPYSVAALGGGAYAVADAGVNAVVRVAPGGAVSTLAVLPPVPVRIHAEAAQAFGLPACAVGATYAFEPVPTDVEVGPDGMLYVTSLAGGPESDLLGPLGGVFRVDPRTGDVRRIASGFAGATGLAVGPEGRVYVAELFGGRISYVKAGRPQPLVDLPLPAAVEFARGSLYVTTDALPGEGAPPDGKVVRVRL